MARRSKLVIQGKKPLPKFRTIEEESDFWDTHSPLDYGRWEEVSFKDVLKDLRSKGQPKRQLSLRLEPELIGRLKRLAKRHGIRYQKLARELLWKGVQGLSA